MSESSTANFENEINNPFIAESSHPERKWLVLTNKENWKLRGLLTFSDPFAAMENFRVKQFFRYYNYFLNGRREYKHIPVIWRFEVSPEEQRLHIHFLLMESSPGFHYRRGKINGFRSDYRLERFLDYTWRNLYHSHGLATIRKLDNQKEIDFWLKYITKTTNRDGSNCGILKTHFTPALDHLRRQTLADISTLNGLDDKAEPL